ncbi:alcohol dehydrogenase catalytic domain-containing protein [Cupriavidus basilensis]|uniref:alcohol dehydrogenase catalytic domain-containing protein n=1 Tax=Cupriavidus basilensis TaxID=68895 RepID=UPI00157B6627|nr:alcohol dehydrogenase catalytic domain-containing protein [Cupriavidus basilensis]NUA27474.1 zinc-binding dehydrogenase [Cupriavidus basilensis]
MKAVQIQKHGPAESLAIVDVDMPAPGPDDLIIRVHAVGVNRLDLLLREGSVFQVPLPRIPGTDFAGDIVDVGVNVDSHRIGERVFAAPILSCGQCKHCLRGEDNLCSKFGTVGSTIDGGYAQFVRVPARNAMALPEQIDYVRGASFALTYATAASMLRRGRLAPGEWVMILGANGGLGYAAVELASAMGARVIAIGRTADTDEALRRAGAAAVVLAGPNMAEQVRALTGGRGVDLVFEHVGAVTFEQSVASLAMDGRLVLGGVTTGTEAPMDLKALFTRRLEILGCRGSGRRDLEHVRDLLMRDLVRPQVQQVMPLEQAAQAHRHLESGVSLGKIILTV